MRPLLLAISLTFLVSACGSRGGLTLPPKPQQLASVGADVSSKTMTGETQ